MKTVLVYALHSGNLYGTERMALATLQGLRDRYTPVLFAPSGPALAEAQRLGMETVAFANPRQFALRLLPYLVRHRDIAFAATGVMHSLVFLAWNLVFRRRAVHLHLVHGGTDERDSYGRKKRLNGRPVTLVAVSEFVRERLIANGANPAQIQVAENFLPDEHIAAAPRRAAFTTAGVRRIAVVSRVDPIKRIDLLLDTLEQHPELSHLEFQIFGTGWDLDTLRDRAARHGLNIRFQGFHPDVPGALAEADVLLHLCPVEPFGLAILEAMAAGIPVLTPNRGGASGLIEPEVSGFHFQGDDAASLAAALQRLSQLAPEQLNAIVAAASERLCNRYSAHAGLDRYRHLFGA